MTARNRGARRRRARESPAPAPARPAEDDRLVVCLRCGRERAPDREAWRTDTEGRWCQCVHIVAGYEGEDSDFRKREYRAAVRSVADEIVRGRRS